MKTDCGSGMFVVHVDLLLGYVVDSNLAFVYFIIGLRIDYFAHGWRSFN